MPVRAATVRERYEAWRRKPAKDQASDSVRRNPAYGHFNVSAARQIHYFGLASELQICNVEIDAMRTLIQDLRFGLRSFLSSPGFTAVTVLTLGLGIAFNTTVFGWVNGLLLRPYPGARDGDRLAVMEMNTVGAPNGANQTSYIDYLDYRANLKSLAGLAVHREDVFTLGTALNAQPVWGELVSGNYFDVLGVRPALGRTFTPQEDANKRGRLPCRGDQPPPVARPLPRRPRRHRQDAARQSGRTHRGRRGARRVSRHHAGTGLRHLDAGDHGQRTRHARRQRAPLARQSRTLRGGPPARRRRHPPGARRSPGLLAQPHSGLPEDQYRRQRPDPAGLGIPWRGSRTAAAPAAHPDGDLHPACC